MEKPIPPRAGELSAKCPNPDLIASGWKHFGRDVWRFECDQAVELFVKDSGIRIKCSRLDAFCPVEDGRDVFVGSPEINSVKNFLQTTLSYLGLN